MPGGLFGLFKSFGGKKQGSENTQKKVQDAGHLESSSTDPGTDNSGSTTPILSGSATASLTSEPESPITGGGGRRDQSQVVVLRGGVRNERINFEAVPDTGNPEEITADSDDERTATDTEATVSDVGSLGLGELHIAESSGGIVPVSRIVYPKPDGIPPPVTEENALARGMCKLFVSRSYTEDPKTGDLPWELADENLSISIIKIKQMVELQTGKKLIEVEYIVLEGSIGRTMTRICEQIQMEFNSIKLLATFGFPSLAGYDIPIMTRLDFSPLCSPDEEGFEEEMKMSTGFFGCFKSLISRHVVFMSRLALGYSNEENTEFMKTNEYGKLVSSIVPDEAMGSEEEDDESNVSEYDFDDPGFVTVPECPLSFSKVGGEDGGAEEEPKRRKTVRARTRKEAGQKTTKKVKAAKKSKRTTQRGNTVSRTPAVNMAPTEDYSDDADEHHGGANRQNGDDFKIAGSKASRMLTGTTPYIDPNSDGEEDEDREYRSAIFTNRNARGDDTDDEGSYEFEDSYGSEDMEDDGYTRTSGIRPLDLSMKPKKYSIADYDNNRNMITSGGNMDLTSKIGDRTYVIGGNSVKVFATPGAAVSQCVGGSLGWSLRTSPGGAARHSSVVGVSPTSPGRKEMPIIGSLDLLALGKGETTGTLREAKPSTMLLKDDRRRLMLLDTENHGNYVYDVDIEYNKVISTYKSNKTSIGTKLNLRDMSGAPGILGKDNACSSGDVFVGLSGKGLHTMDARIGGDSQLVSESVVAKMGGKRDGEYLYSNSTRGLFTCIAASKYSTGLKPGCAQIAVGDTCGTIRLFDKVGIKSKSALETSSQPIRAIDITTDGRFIVATGIDKLFVFDVAVKEGKFAGQLGYSKSLKSDNPQMIVLRLKDTDRPKIVGSNPAFSSSNPLQSSEIEFAPARFSIPENPTAKNITIVSGAGSCVITWNLGDVLNDKIYNYSIKPVSGRVVSSAFETGTQNVVVTTDHDVYYEARKKKK